MLARIGWAFVNLHARSMIKFWGERFVERIVREGCSSWNPISRWYWKLVLYRVKILLDEALDRRFMREMAKYLSDME